MSIDHTLNLVLLLLFLMRGEDVEREIIHADGARIASVHLTRNPARVCSRLLETLIRPVAKSTSAHVMASNSPRRQREQPAVTTNA